jgi:hypothetical protein
MADVKVLDRAFQCIMRRLVESGRAPHYTELAAALGCAVEDGRQVLHAVTDAFLPGWLYPGTDYVASFAPFNNVPTQYRISIAGQQKWFAQCGFEALAVTWVFPGQNVRIDAPCLDCNEPLVLEMRDGRFLTLDPPGVIGHLNHPWTTVKEKLAFL